MTSASASRKMRCAIGNQNSQKARPRPTAFSHSRDCDSCTPSDTASPIGRSILLAIESLLVEAVADLVHDAEKRVGEMVLVEPGRDPAISWPDPRAKRMGGHVQPAALEVETHRRRHSLAENLLPITRIVIS